MQFITTDKDLEFGGTVQENAMEYLNIDDKNAKRVWELGGRESFRKGISTKRKTTMYGVKTAITKSK